MNYGVILSNERRDVNDIIRRLNIKDVVLKSSDYIKTENAKYTILKEGYSARGHRFDCIYFDDRIPWNVFRLLPYMLKAQYIPEYEKRIIPITF